MPFADQIQSSFQTPLRYPILDSFPNTLFHTTKNDSVRMLAALTTSSRTGERIKSLETVAGRIISIDERETIVNGLGEIQEAYESGWASNSEVDDD